MRLAAYQQQQHVLKNQKQTDLITTKSEQHNNNLFDILNSKSLANNQQNDIQNKLYNINLLELDATLKQFLVYICLKCDKFHTSSVDSIKGLKLLNKIT